MVTKHDGFDRRGVTDRHVCFATTQELKRSPAPGQEDLKPCVMLRLERRHQHSQ
jgi:hypothetical protein